MQHNLITSITVKGCSNHGQLSDRNRTRETTRTNTPSPRANPGAPLRPCLAMRQAGCEAQGDGFYSRSPSLRRLKNSVESRCRRLDRAAKSREVRCPGFHCISLGYTCCVTHNSLVRLMTRMTALTQHGPSVPLFLAKRCFINAGISCSPNPTRLRRLEIR